MNKKYEETKRWREANPWFRPLEYARRRCRDKKHREYFRYGGRGIQCLLTSAEAKILYARDNGHLLRQPSLDRIDPDGHYCFENCRYIERSENIGMRRNRIPQDAEIPKPEEPSSEDWED